MSEMHRCPRRVESYIGLMAEGDPDTWIDQPRRCTWCGSVHPDDFMQMVELGAELGPTDKTYKVYLSGAWKFYFQHLSDAQQDRFFELMKIGKLNIGHPGRFHILPFFIIAREKRIC